MKDKLRDPEILLCLRLSVNGYRDLWASFSIVKEEILDKMSVFSSLCILRFCVFAKESSIFEVLNVN